MIMDGVFQDSLNSPEFSVFPAHWDKDLTYGVGGILKADPQKISYFKY